MKVLLAVAALSALAGAAQAQIPPPSLYGSLGYDRKEDSNLDAVQARVGARFGRYVGVEAEFAKGVEPDTVSFPSVPTFSFKTQLREELAAYVVGYLPVSPKADLFARAGYGNSWFKYTFAFDPTVAVTKRDQDSWNYGVGGQYFLDAKNGVRVDYTRQDFNGRPTEDTWSVAYTRRF